MSISPNAYSLALGIATAIIAVVGLVAWRNRDRSASIPFIVLLFGVGLWTLGNALQLAATELGLKIGFRTLAYVGHNVVPIAFLVFAVSYTGNDEWLSNRRIAVLGAEPMLVGLVLTPLNAIGLHSLVWRDLWLSEFASLVVLSRSFGPVYWVNTGYNYLLIFGGVYLFAELVFEASDIGRKQGLALLTAVFPPFLANILWIRGLTPIDYTPFAFVITGVAFGLALYRYRLFDVVPIAHESILDSVSDGYLVVDDAGRVLDYNEAATELLTTDADPMHQSLGEVLPEVASFLEDEPDAALPNGNGEPRQSGPGRAADPSQPTELELERDGTLQYVEVQVSPLEDRPGRLLFLRDVTEKRQVERRYRKLIENSLDLITVLDGEEEFSYASPSAERLLGWTPDELVGMNAFDPIHPDDEPAVREEFKQALADPEYTAAAEYRYQRADGSWIWLSSRGKNRFDDPFVEGFVVNSRDVTARRRRERALERQNERLDEFTGAVSHDLRNPLTVIRGRLELARETGEEEHFAAMETAVDRMETLIEDLLQLARQGRLVGETEPVELAPLAREVWDQLERGEATLDCPDALGSVAADRERLYQVFENLFRNAVEHGGASVTVSVGELSDGFYVVDDGPGIPPDEREEVFQRGYTTSEDGTGFGLSIVQSIASAHGWTIAVTESAESGARFEITGVERTATPETA